jgi:homogentisate 1,2-dioxygenase
MIYHHLGEIPSKRHKIYRKPSGQLYTEELMGNMGFVGPSSLLYHVRPPTAVRLLRSLKELKWDVAPTAPLRHRHFQTKQLPRPGNAIAGRVPLLFNNDVAISIVHPGAEATDFYRNAQGDEIVYVSEGRGSLESPFGKLVFRGGDYLLIPRGILHRYRFDSAENVLLILESAGYVRPPKSPARTGALDAASVGAGG